MQMIKNSVLLLWLQLLTSVKCQAIRCSIPQIEHGRVVGTAQEYQENEILDFRCDEAYKRADERTPRCTKFAGKADWSPTPACKPIKCDLALASIPGTTYDPPYKNMFSPGETVRVTCGEKHWILDMQTTVADVTCGIRGDWDTRPICQEVTCPRYIDEAHLYRSVNAWGRNKIGDRVRYDCANNYDPASSDRMATCTREGWTPKPLCRAIRCSVPQIEHGRVVGTAQEYQENEILDFRCDEAYKRADERTPRCTKFAGKADWSPTPACKPIKCDLALASIPGTTYDPSYKNMFSPGETVRVTCGEKHWILDMQTTVADVTCGIRGDWDTNPICQEVTCPRYIDEAHLYRSVNAWGRNKIGDRVRYDCANNYDPASSDRMATCTREGWTPKPLCRGRRCENPNIENSRITRGSKRTYYNGDRLTYECLGGNQEPVTITCERGAWVGIKPCPAPSNCSAPPALEDGDTKAIIRSDSEYQHGERVEYLCQNKYTMAGGPFKTCDNDVWKGDIRCLKPCTVTQQLMNEHNVQFAHFEDSKIFVPHTDHIAFVCKSGKRLDGTVPLRVQCNDGEINLPTCQ